MTPWWLLAMQGGAALLLGVMLLSSRPDDATVLVSFLGWYWLASGVLGLVGAFMDHTVWGVKLTSSVLAIAGATWVIRYPPWAAPASAAESYLWAAGLLAIGIGSAQLVEAFYDGGYALRTVGAFSLVLGMFLVFAPLGSGLSLPVVLGTSAVIAGSGAVAFAFDGRDGR